MTESTRAHSLRVETGTGFSHNYVRSAVTTDDQGRLFVHDRHGHLTACYAPHGWMFFRVTSEEGDDEDE